MWVVAGKKVGIMKFILQKSLDIAKLSLSLHSGWEQLR
jgi:hypothetical protein